MDYVLHLLVIISLYTMLAQALSLLAGFGGMVSLCQAGFCGIGAYASAILSTRFGFSFWGTLPIALAISIFVAWIISVVAVRTVGEYFVVCTLGIQVVLMAAMNNWTEVTSGPTGISGIPPISVGGIMVGSKLSFFALSASMAAGIWAIVRNLVDSGFGRALRALSEDEVFTASVGRNVREAKIVAFSLGSGLASIPGALYAHYYSYIDPTSFSVSESILILCIVILGGQRSLRGTCIASAVLVVLPELLRFAGLPTGAAANLKQIIYGVVLIFIMMTNASSARDLLRRSRRGHSRQGPNSPSRAT